MKNSPSILIPKTLNTLILPSQGALLFASSAAMATARKTIRRVCCESSAGAMHQKNREGITETLNTPRIFILPWFHWSLLMTVFRQGKKNLKWNPLNLASRAMRGARNQASCQDPFANPSGLLEQGVCVCVCACYECQCHAAQMCLCRRNCQHGHFHSFTKRKKKSQCLVKH